MTSTSAVLHRLLLTLTAPTLAVAASTGCASAPGPLPAVSLVEAVPAGPPTPAPTPVPDLGQQREELLQFMAPPRQQLVSYVSDPRTAQDGFAGPEEAETYRSTEIYGYRPGVVYQVRTTPGFLTTIVLEKGERISHLGSGDSDRWAFQQVAIGDGEQAETTVLVKPTVAPLATNLVIATDRRLYQVELLAEPSADRYQSLVRWRYAGKLLARRGLSWSEMSPRIGGKAAEEAPPAPSNRVPVDLNKLDFDYHIRVHKGKSPRWTPVSAFHDGSKTYLRFPSFFDQLEAPSVFASEGDEAQVVNFRVVAGMYVIDRVLDLAILKLGSKKQDVVYVEYVGDFFDEANR